MKRVHDIRECLQTKEHKNYSRLKYLPYLKVTTDSTKSTRSIHSSIKNKMCLVNTYRVEITWISFPYRLNVFQLLTIYVSTPTETLSHKSNFVCYQNPILIDFIPENPMSANVSLSLSFWNKIPHTMSFKFI